MDRVKAVAFDLDDTLVRTSVDFKKMKQEIIHLLGTLGLNEEMFSTSELTYTIIERGSNSLAAQGVSEPRLREIRAEITEIMNRVELESVSRVEAVPGALKVLLKLRDCGIRIGVVTRGCRAYTLAALERAGLSGAIDLILARDDVERPKPHPAHLIELAARLGVGRDEILLVGDHRTDYECAQAAQIPFVGIISRGSNLADLVKADRKAAVLDSIDELPDFLLGLPFST